MAISEAFNEDNIVGMKRFPDKFFDLAVLDPQTGQNEGKKHASRGKSVVQKNGNILSLRVNHVQKEWDEQPPTQEYWDEVFRVSKNQIIMCENYLHFNQKSTSAGRIIWNLLRDNDFSACQIMWTSLTNKIDYFEYMWNGMLQGIGINSRIQKGNKEHNETRIHPSQKPAIVYDYLLRKYAKPGYKIVDTHMGSQNSRIASFKLDLDYWGWESDADYFEDGNNAFKKAISEPLFQTTPTASQAKIF